MNPLVIRDALTRFLAEDLGRVGYAYAPGAQMRNAVIEAEEDGVMCGGSLLLPLFSLATPDGCAPPRSVALLPDGEPFRKGTELAHIEVHEEALRHGIRTALNLLQHLCGIATRTRELVKLVEGTSCTLLDTRKTTPGLRVFEKHATRVGGAKNHRFGRDDGVMVKLEDVLIAGGIVPAIDVAVSSVAQLTAVEIEVRSLVEFGEVLADGRVRHVMLDNMTIENVHLCVLAANGRLVLEVSGIPIEEIPSYAATGVSFISTSAMIGTARKSKLHLQA